MALDYVLEKVSLIGLSR